MYQFGVAVRGRSQQYSFKQKNFFRYVIFHRVTGVPLGPGTTDTIGGRSSCPLPKTEAEILNTCETTEIEPENHFYSICADYDDDDGARADHLSQANATSTTENETEDVGAPEVLIHLKSHTVLVQSSQKMTCKYL